jgi:hypothetical protein
VVGGGRDAGAAVARHPRGAPGARRFVAGRQRL